MIYYFVDWEGELTSEDNAKGWFRVDDVDTFSDKRKAIRQAKKRINARIAELNEYYKTVGKGEGSEQANSQQERGERHAGGISR